MNSGFTIQTKVHFRRIQRGQRALKAGAEPTALPVGRVPRIARLMALAIHFDGLIQSKAFVDQAELARLGHVSRARLTQIMNLLLLAPEIQEDLLFLPLVTEGRCGIHLRLLQPITQVTDWSAQRQMWANLNLQRRQAQNAE